MQQSVNAGARGGRRARRHGTNRRHHHRHVASADLIDHRRHRHVAPAAGTTRTGLAGSRCSLAVSASLVSPGVNLRLAPPPATTGKHGHQSGQPEPAPAGHLFVVSHSFPTLRRVPHTAFFCSDSCQLSALSPIQSGLGAISCQSRLFTNFTREPIADGLSSEKSFKKSASFVLSRDLHFPLQLASAGFDVARFVIVAIASLRCQLELVDRAAQIALPGVLLT